VTGRASDLNSLLSSNKVSLHHDPAQRLIMWKYKLISVPLIIIIVVYIGVVEITPWLCLQGLNNVGV